MDKWLAADSLDHLLGNEQMVRTLANVGSHVCASNGGDVAPSVLIYGEEAGAIPRQSPEEQQARFEMIAAQQNASW